MRCPFCHNKDTFVKDSRVVEDLSTIKRRRCCAKCGGRFTTLERPYLKELTVIKKNGRRIPFDRERLTKSIMLAVHKKSLNEEAVSQIVTGIIRRLETSGEVEISSHRIGEMVLLSLLHLDPVAYIRFASIYQEFNSLKDFSLLLKKFDNNEELKIASTDQLSLPL